MAIITITLPVTPAQAEAVTKAGAGATIHHARARSHAGRRQLADALRLAGVSNTIVRTLGYSTTGAPAEPKAVPTAAGKLEPDFEPEPELDFDGEVD